MDMLCRVAPGFSLSTYKALAQLVSKANYGGTGTEYRVEITLQMDTALMSADELQREIEEVVDRGINGIQVNYVSVRES